MAMRRTNGSGNICKMKGKNRRKFYLYVFDNRCIEKKK
jgi:hypothetical protein